MLKQLIMVFSTEKEREKMKSDRKLKTYLIKRQNGICKYVQIDTQC